jgi:hypothetical protein
VPENIRGLNPDDPNAAPRGAQARPHAFRSGFGSGFRAARTESALAIDGE